MNNTVILTDDELSAIQASLKITIDSYEVYIQKNGVDKLDLNSITALDQMKLVHEKLNKLYFE